MKLLNPRDWPRQVRLYLIFGVCITASLSVFLTKRVPLGDDYHHFADNRAILGVSNACNVISNIPFLVVGLMGLIQILGRSSCSIFLDERERTPYLVFFAGVMLTGIGSLWYHLAPSNSRLPWDLLPMTCSFVSIAVIVYMERVSIKYGSVILVPLLSLGMSSVAYWYASERQGHGDYKYYLFVQFFSPVILAFIVGLFPSRYAGMGYLVVAFALFAAAKLFERFDFRIYRVGDIVSGHSLKHIVAALACFCILRRIQVRHVVGPQIANGSHMLHDQEKLTFSR